jgi:small subunit ribosomal protein S4
MARYTGPKTKISRRFRTPIFGPNKALDRKNYAPGQHGRNKRSKVSDFGIQLAEKVKLKYLYGVLERQLRKTFAAAARKTGNKGDNFMALLEARLDNTVYRMGFAPTRRGARQLVSHGHILVNGKPVNIASYSLRPGDVVEVRERSKSLEVIQDSVQRKGSRYNWIDVDKIKLSGQFLAFPERDQIPENINEKLVVELYSKYI